ncbi:MAG TPA: sigma-54 dependent transcriptional regulator [Thiobacillaceae bacterium]|nr:sigma-54 dependent transcriptional regulator [Thiobacillaceae bacterium]HNA81650.1 sigma-54 dependent transcriptional regulator [Thiobacillaceae bacterium]HNF88139.1 sigma-54 dependent transcriptional regulator [Thiobacillaceae bacterium]HNH88479.1 sigma-54 dependent transcriptional regulator [Thiobacillaceae bacterium]HNI06893.1 sigma-54 dependent transcriptional regulator [Thiobacillaceae bacterium]
MSQAHILLIDDEAIALANLSHVLEREGHRVTACKDGAEGMAALAREDFDLVLTDLKMPGVDGMEVLRQVRQKHTDTPVVMITGHATLDSAVEAMKAGAFHYLAKPFRLAEAREVVKSALELCRVKRENQELRLRIESLDKPHTIVTQDLGMQRLLDTARKLASTDSNVVIYGESGTGKELLARYLHQSSHRARGPFIAFNCGALTEDLAASELFGHEKGAFTGAQVRKLGLIEAANGGTVFLDEVAELPPSVQIKLLRVLQEREVLRVGAIEPAKVDVRVVAASNRDLQAAVEAGQLRADLYFRLNVVTLTLPPLRERRGDIPLLAYYLLRKFAAAMNRPVRDIAPDALERLMEYDYPGNVRELSNFIERGVALAEGEQLTLDFLPQHLGRLTVRVFAPAGASTPTTLEAQEKEHILRALEMSGGNRTEAAKILGIDRVSLWRKLKKLGVGGK